MYIYIYIDNDNTIRKIIMKRRDHAKISGFPIRPITVLLV